MDLCAISDCGPYANQGDGGTLGSTATSLYNPETIRFRGVSVLTNTPPRVAQRAPGGEQASAMLEPLISKAARQLGIDQVEIRKVNAPSTGSQFGPPPPEAAVAAAKAKGVAPPSRTFFTSCHLREALDMGAKLFNWEERKKRNGQRVGTKVTGVGVGLGTYTAGSINMDGLLLIRPDGKVYVQQGVGNLGTGSVHDTARIVAEELDTPWEHFEIVWGSTGKHVAWSSPQAGSQTIHAHTRANLAAAQDLKKKLQGDRGARARWPPGELCRVERPRRTAHLCAGSRGGHQARR